MTRVAGTTHCKDSLATATRDKIERSLLVSSIVGKYELGITAIVRAYGAGRFSRRRLEQVGEDALKFL